MKHLFEKEPSDQVPSILDLIGNTPLVRITRITSGLGPGVKIYAKLECGNPGGSVKTGLPSE